MHTHGKKRSQHPEKSLLLILDQSTNRKMNDAGKFKFQYKTLLKQELSVNNT